MSVPHHQAEQRGGAKQTLADQISQEAQAIGVLDSSHCVVCHDDQVRWHSHLPLTGQLDHLLQGLAQNLQEMVLQQGCAGSVSGAL